MYSLCYSADGFGNGTGCCIFIYDETGDRKKTINIVKAGAFSAYANGIIAVAVCVIYRMYTGNLLIVPDIQPVFHGIFMMILLRILRLIGSGNIAKGER